jgi:hypothetical protein
MAEESVTEGVSERIPERIPGAGDGAGADVPGPLPSEFPPSPPLVPDDEDLNDKVEIFARQDIEEDIERHKSRAAAAKTLFHQRRSDNDTL